MLFPIVKKEKENSQLGLWPTLALTITKEIPSCDPKNSVKKFSNNRLTFL